MPNALDQILLPYQKAWVLDESRFKIGMWSRQTGKSFSTACEAVRDCLLRPGQLWVCLSAGERQAFEWLRKARQWAEAFKIAVDSYKETANIADAAKSKAEIVFKNGSRILAIPANPDTARGYSANLVLDEFAIHERSWDIWAAIYPSISNPLSGDKRLRIVSTPKGLGNKFADLWQKNDAYSKHKITIEGAAAQGLGVDIATLKAGVDDADIWAQEFLCEFIDSSGVLLPYEMLQACTLPATPTAPDDAPRFLGMDIGRSHDLSVLIEAAKLPDGVLQIVRVDVLAKMEFHRQLEILAERARPRTVRRVCVDATGIGAMLAEEARRLVGAKVEPVTFTAATKGEMYTALRRTFEDRTVRIGPDRELREDLHAVERKVSGGGAVSYAAARNADGHSDRAAALALCLRAAAARGGTFFLPRVFGRRTAADERTYA